MGTPPRARRRQILVREELGFGDSRDRRWGKFEYGMGSAWNGQQRIDVKAATVRGQGGDDKGGGELGMRADEASTGSGQRAT
ncbi:hypothetical protein M0R45_009021 [Rubus argutus]|uniref:Uncharacterized protein n=1 Tax=Rubus argutus TaxID=59490 RepID=A0AAW1Y5U1_RUBAR